MWSAHICLAYEQLENKTDFFYGLKAYEKKTTIHAAMTRRENVTKAREDDTLNIKKSREGSQITASNSGWSCKNEQARICRII